MEILDFMSKKDKKIFKKSPVIVPKLTVRNKWTVWRTSETKKLSAQSANVVRNLILHSLLLDQTSEEEVRDRIQYLRFLTDKNSSISKPKNYCYYTGRSRSVTRCFFMSRHILRKFARFGIMSGLIQERC